MLISARWLLSDSCPFLRDDEGGEPLKSTHKSDTKKDCADPRPDSRVTAGA
jgi:hypothetical protein